MTAANRLDAAMQVMRPQARPGQVVPYRIINTGNVELICGFAYRLERETAESWVHMNPRMAFRLIGFGVSPGQYRELDARIPDDAPAGSYRLVASVGSDHTGGTVEVSAEFAVVTGE